MDSSCQYQRETKMRHLFRGSNSLGGGAFIENHDIKRTDNKKALMGMYIEKYGED